MKNIKSILGAALLSVFFNPTIYAEQFTTAKIAELGCHRIERLVTLKKIPEAYLNNFKSITVETLIQSSTTDPAYKIRSNQVSGIDGKEHSVEILTDTQGKPVSFLTTSGSDSLNPPIWPTKDAVTLTEESLHYLLENGETDANVRPFYTGFKSAILSQEIRPTGEIEARVIFESSETPKKMNIRLKSDGTVIEVTFRD